jgi:hypothetical protein
MEKTVRELCLICKGERWIPDPLDSAHSLPCPYCEAQGWVVVAPANFMESPPDPAPEPREK